MSRKRNYTGFTIVELLIVIVVIGILAAIAAVAFGTVQSRARDSERASEIASLQKALDLFHAENGRFPTIVEIRNNPAQLLNVPENTLRVGNGQLINYCQATDSSRYCYIPRQVEQSIDCGYSDATMICQQYILNYRTEANPGTRIDLRSSVRS